MIASVKVSIPKPCYENWNSMSIDEKGRFCSVCAKTVIDFTKMNAEETQNYLWKHKDKKICGRFQSDVVDSTFVFRIPKALLYQQRSFKKAFLLALFVVMGATLFSCQNTTGQTMGEVAQDYDQEEVIEDTVKDQVLMNEYVSLDTIDSISPSVKLNAKEVDFKGSK